MSTIWFTSDTHFFHRMVAGLRGFESTEAHDEAIIANWNAKVRYDDIVWHLGDVGMTESDTKILTKVDRLLGRIHLVTGNHDSPWPAHRQSCKKQRTWMGVFESVQAFAKIKIGSEPVLLSHFPYNGDHSPHDRYTQFRLRDEGAWLLHGHIHQETRMTSDHSIHVGLDAWDLAPVSVDEIITRMHKRVS